MKKFGIVLVMGLLLAMSVSTAEAQKPYKMSIGAVVGNFEGASFKMFITNNLVLQADLGFKLNSYGFEYYHNKYSSTNFWTIELNPNLAYEGLIKDWDAGSFHWFAGGGLSIGYVLTNDMRTSIYNLDDPHGKFGINGIGGAEFAFKRIPLTTQVDFRPGWGSLFGDGSKSFFDYSVNASVRYTF